MEKNNYNFDDNANYKVTLTRKNAVSKYEFEGKNEGYEKILENIGRDYIVHFALPNGNHYAVNLINFDSVSIEKID